MPWQEAFTTNDRAKTVEYCNGVVAERVDENHLRTCYHAASVRFDYQWDDVLARS
ncbi:hypothetical protein ACFFQW_18045 [Umezawaea endophytica]|uniref:Uncharacterized protein n=1 Tax=Umezawaea endophytica TaxID=1654476 RepID=A0A9X3AFP0_9PSEU|nr:hypothetical protein [Umezawaea endophytica]MCS7478561.1 hypothetical protein [Umezawaea endophytica]